MLTRILVAAAGTALALYAGRALAKRVRQNLDPPDTARVKTPDDLGAPQHPKLISPPTAPDDGLPVEGNDTPESSPATSTDGGARDESDTQVEQHRSASVNGEGRAVDSVQRTRRAPIASGGRPRTPNRPESTRRTQSTRSFAGTVPRAHLCVWQQGMGWQLGVEVQSKSEQDLSVRQGGVELERDDFDPDRWLLADKLGVIDISDDESRVTRISDLARGPAHLLFRLVGADLEHGILVQQPSAGAFLLLVPCDWIPPESESSDVVVDAGPVTPPTFRAYYVDIEPGSAATVRAGADTTSTSAIRFNDAGRRFSLTGTDIEDAAPRHAKRSARQGALFGKSAPTIVDTQSWSGVSTIVVGEEGDGRGRWREEIDRKTHNPSKRLRELLTERPVGWFFLRFYDEQDDLIDSLDFRYAAGINAPPRLIEAGEPAPEREFDKVLIEHDSSVRVEATRSDDLKLSSHPEADSESLLRIPHRKDYDHTEWVVTDGGACVPLHIEVLRTWWRLRNEQESGANQWISEAIQFRMEDFKATSLQVLDVSMPAAMGASEQARIGFDHSGARRCGASRSGEFAFPLRELESSQALQRAGRSVLRLYPPVGAAIDLGTLELRARCACCEAEVPAGASGQVKHLFDSHFHNVFHELDYEETARLYPELKFPGAIYDCLQCEQFVPAGSGDPNPTTAIIRHCYDNHSGRSRFRPMTRSDEVRRHMFEVLPHALPHAYRCSFCKKRLKTEADSASQILKSHLRHHLNRLTTLG